MAIASTATITSINLKMEHDFSIMQPAFNSHQMKVINNSCESNRLNNMAFQSNLVLFNGIETHSVTGKKEGKIEGNFPAQRELNTEYIFVDYLSATFCKLFECIAFIVAHSLKAFNGKRLLVNFTQKYFMVRNTENIHVRQ